MLRPKPRAPGLNQQLAEAAIVSRQWDAWHAANTGAAAKSAGVRRALPFGAAAATAAGADRVNMMAAKDRIMEHVISANELIKESGACLIGEDYDAEGCVLFAASLTDQEYEACLGLKSAMTRIVENNVSAKKYRLAVMEHDFDKWKREHGVGMATPNAPFGVGRR
jgi:hypothetical protein